jgi:heme-degrading monooxygenase HmoA
MRTLLSTGDAAVADREETVMFARIVTFTSAKNIDAGLEFTRESVVPVLRQQHGYRGATASINRETGVVGVMSLWETDADRDASFGALEKTRDEAIGIVGGEMTVEGFEETVVVMAATPGIGSPLLIRRISMDPATVEKNLDFFKREVLPRIQALPGFRAARQMVDRQTGEGVVGTVWDDADAMEAAAQDAERRQEQAASQGVTLGEQYRREIALIDMP